MSKIRLFFKEKIVNSKSIALDSEKTHYLKRVMRKKNGDKITIFNGKEQWEVELNLTEYTVKPEKKTGMLGFVPDIYLYFSLLKNKQTNYLIEKVCELGVKKIIPLKTEFSENFNPKISLPNNLSISPIGVITIKKTNSITIGAIIFPKISPNLIHPVFNGLSTLGLVSPKNKKINAMTKAQTLTKLKLNNG